MRSKTFIIFIALVIGGFLAVSAIKKKADEVITQTAVNVPATLPTVMGSVVVQTPTPENILEPATITYEGYIPDGYNEFIEDYPKIDGERGYVAFPKVIETENPPAIVVYSHGSGQKITTNFEEEVMKNMRSYGHYFSIHNMAFIASNQHGDNQGSSTAVDDSRKLIDWVKKKYMTSQKIYLIGFSMGGKPAMKHVVLHPKEISRIALLAPAQQVETFSSTQIKYFRDVKLKVWHGTADVNVPYWVTEEIQTYFKKYSTPVVVITLKGKTHWDVDTEYMEDLYKWFEEDRSGGAQ